MDFRGCFAGSMGIEDARTRLRAEHIELPGTVLST